MLKERIMTQKPSNVFEDIVNLYLLTECDMHCSFCYASKGLGRLTFDQIKFVLDELARRGAQRVSITGGEPLLHENIRETLEYAASVGLQVTLFTSGSLLTEAKLRDFLPYLSWLCLSIDGDRETDRKVGRSKEHFDSAINALELVKKLAPDLKVRVASVVTRINIDNIQELAKILSDPIRSPSLWRIKQMLPSRGAGKMASRIAVDEKEFLEKMSKVKDSHKDMNIQIHTAHAKSGDMICIHPDGNSTTTVYPEGGDDLEIFSLGNIFTDTDKVFAEWDKKKDSSHANSYRDLWQAPESVS